MVALGLIGLLAMDNCGRDARFDTGFPFETGRERFETGSISDADIRIAPGRVEFDDLLVGDEATLSVEILNLGDDDLQLFNILLEQTDEDFSLGAVNSVLIPGGDSTSFEVSFSPTWVGEHEALIFIESNDPDAPGVELAVLGTGVAGAGALELSPEAFDFGAVTQGTSQDQTLLLSNLGDGPLEVLEIQAESASLELTHDPMEGENGPLPWRIEVGESIETRVNYTPTDALSDTLYVRVSSDDPENPEHIATFTGVGAEE